MCDYHTTNLDGWAMMRALRKKDATLYAKAVRSSFENTRPDRTTTAYCEQVTGNDCLDPAEFPPAVLQELFGSDPVFPNRPFSYMFEVLASNVTPERLDAFKAQFGAHRRLFFDFGFESTEWLRAHWINKPCLDATIERAIRTLHDYRYFAMADMIIGIPGLTECQSVAVFHDTVQWLHRAGIDRVVCLPLNRKPMTLQGFLHRELRDNGTLTRVGIAQGEHTGVPWLYTVLDALCSLQDLGADIYRKVSIAATSSSFVLGTNETAYNASAECACNAEIVFALETFQRRHDPAVLFAAREQTSAHACHDQYLALIERQRAAGSVRETLRLLGQELAKTLFPSDWQSRLAEFDGELASCTESRAATSHELSALHRH
jgi:hypothetical protein